MNTVRDLMGHCSAQERVKINSVCLSKTRFVIRGNFRQYILIAGLQLSITLVMESSSNVCRHLSTIHHVSIRHCHVGVDERMINVHSSSSTSSSSSSSNACCLLAPHLSGVAVGLRNPAATVCDAC